MQKQLFSSLEQFMDPAVIIGQQASASAVS